MGVVSRRWMWVESMGVVVRRYIDLILPSIMASLTKWWLLEAYFATLQQ